MKCLCRNLRKFSQSVNNKEMDNFTKMTGWWDPNSPMNMLYEYNYHRIGFLKNSLKKHHMIEKPPKPFLNLKVLDVGCGAGILSESMTRLGASVLAIDPNPTSIREALNHQKGDDTVSSIQYRQMTLEELLKVEQGKFDLVTSMEVLQHVQNSGLFVKNLSLALKDKGFMMLSTISRHWKSYLTHVLVAEYLAKIIPAGTHDHSKFINPQELDKYLTEAGCQPLDKQAFEVDLQGEFKVGNQGSNYLVFAQKTQNKENQK